MSDEKDLTVQHGDDAQRATRPRRTEKSVTLFGAFLMQVVTIALCLTGAYVLDIRRGESPPVVIADTAAIVNAQLLAMQDKGLTAEEFNKQSTAFVGKMLQRIEEYRAAGFTVVNSQAVLAAPQGQDISGELATFMGVNPNALQQFAQARPAEPVLAQ